MRRLASILAASLLTLALAGPALAAPNAHATRYYLSLGDSLAAGQQPIGDPADMYRTSDGYADQLYAMARARYPHLEHVKLGCPGETTVTFVEGGICEYAHGSQLDEAIAFLDAHLKATVFITIDIGWNDFPCETGIECVPPGVASIQAHLPGILDTLRAHAPRVPIAGATMYDPFLAYWLQGTPEGRYLATISVSDAIVPINDLVAGIYASRGIPVADVEGFFLTTHFTPEVPLTGFGTVPINVAVICGATWVCTAGNNHANHYGYLLMALAFRVALHL